MMENDYRLNDDDENDTVQILDSVPLSLVSMTSNRSMGNAHFISMKKEYRCNLFNHNTPPPPPRHPQPEHHHNHNHNQNQQHLQQHEQPSPEEFIPFEPDHQPLAPPEYIHIVPTFAPYPQPQPAFIVVPQSLHPMAAHLYQQRPPQRQQPATPEEPAKPVEPEKTYASDVFLTDKDVQCRKGLQCERQSKDYKPEESEDDEDDIDYRCYGPPKRRKQRGLKSLPCTFAHVDPTSDEAKRVLCPFMNFCKDKKKGKCPFRHRVDWYDESVMLACSHITCQINHPKSGLNHLQCVFCHLYKQPNLNPSFD